MIAEVAALAYQIGSTDAFESSDETVDGGYVDGISVTIGSPRRHVATFAVGPDYERVGLVRLELWVR